MPVSMSTAEATIPALSDRTTRVWSTHLLVCCILSILYKAIAPTAIRNNKGTNAPISTLGLVLMFWNLKLRFTVLAEDGSTTRAGCLAVILDYVTFKVRAKTLVKMAHNYWPEFKI